MLKMFEKGCIGSLTLKNKIIMAPMGTKTDPDGGFSARSIRYYQERAKGGVGMVITGLNGVQTKYEPQSCNLLTKFHHVDRLSILAEKVQQLGAKLCIQLGPGLGRMQFTDPSTAPSAACTLSNLRRPPATSCTSLFSSSFPHCWPTPSRSSGLTSNSL